MGWNFILLLLLMLIIIWPKGLSSEQICSKSAETVCRVQKCPASQTEWDKAAQRKNCSEIQKYDNCTKVEYHCLVNEFRNETIEVCSNRRLVQGYCPIYSKNKAKNDYNNYCSNQTSPCNCSSVYNSTEAYKWQCCYNRTNINSQWNQNDQDNIKNNCGGNTNATDSDKDQSSNGHLGLWIVLGIVGGLVGIVFLACVIYGIKRQKKPLCEALQIWRNISCKSPICPCLSSGSEKDEHDNNHSMTNATTKDKIVQHGSEEINALLGDREDKLNSVTNEANSPEEETSNSNEKSGTELSLDSSNDLNIHMQESDPRAEGMALNPETKDNDSLNAENTMVKPIVEQALGKRVKHLEDLKKELEKELYPSLVPYSWYLNYKVKGTLLKMENMKKNSYGGFQMAQITLDQVNKNKIAIVEKVGILEKILKEMHHNIDEVKRDYGNLENFNPKQKKSTFNYNAKDYNTHHAKEEKEEDDNGASVVQEKLSAEDRIWTLIENFENWRSAIQEGRSGIDNMKEKLLETEADIVILKEEYFKTTSPENKTEDEDQQKESNVNKMKQTFEELNKMFDELEKKYRWSSDDLRI